MKIALLGTGLIGTFYTMSLHGLRSRDKVVTVYSRSEERGAKFAKENNIPKWTTDLQEAVSDPDVDVVVVGLPNNLHKDAIFAAVDAGKAVLCTKPLARNAEEAWEILQKVEEAGVFHGYLEDLVYTPKHLKAHP
ncbi:MAG: Gfo/Idh/MocA family oxidoreductase, partial [Prolixibacteraceae bacterium]|nr:Gfo/Idh/MocA family oxidoreductase [Prolixibacteraceae bacterium]